MITINKKLNLSLPVWSLVWPVVAWIVFLLTSFVHWPPYFLLSTIALTGGVLSAVYHAEVIAHRVGEPYGALILALAVTIIEVSLIVSLMFAGGASASGLARDTVFAAVMIILNGMIGLSILSGAIKFREQTFTLQGISSALTILVAISALTLILPNYTTTTPGPFFSKAQLIFVAIITLVLYTSFLFVQNIRHRSDFLPETEEEFIGDRPSAKTAIASSVLLIVCLGAVVLLAKSLAPGLESWIEAVGAPISLTGVILAFIVLLPEGLTALKAANNNQLQKSFNLSLGSALASIGLTIPAVSVVSIYTGLPLSLGLSVQSTVLFLLSLFVIILSLSTGKTTILQGIVLLVLFSVYLFTIILP